MSTVDAAVATIFALHARKLDFAASKLRFRRTDGLVDGGTIEHLSELRASRRMLHDYVRPWRNL